MNYKLTVEDVDRITGENARIFMALHPEYYGCAENSQSLLDWAELQVGTQYPISLETFEAGLEYLQREGVLLSRPANKQQLETEQRVSQRYIDSIAQEKSKQELQNMPLSALKILANVQRHQLKGQPKPSAQAGSESRQVGAGKPISAQSLAEWKVMQQYPSLKRGSNEYNRLVFKEV